LVTGPLEHLPIALSSGAIDYALTPTNWEEVLRRAKIRTAVPSFTLGTYTLTWQEPRLRVGDNSVTFTGQEGRILTFLLYNQGQIIPKERFQAELNISNTSRSLDVLISRIRKKVKSLLPKVENPIRQVRGKGYYFDI
jgi:DNA-binding response OmpR family regulator